MTPGGPLGTFGYYEQQRFPRLSFHNTQAQAQADAQPYARPRPSRENTGEKPWLTPSELPLIWSRPAPRGPGFYNSGNSCYLNASLQCLFALPPFCAMLDSSTSSTQRYGGYCAHCSLLTIARQYSYARSSGQRNAKAISPSPLTSNLRSFSGLRPGRMEDSGEFINCIQNVLARTQILGCGRTGHTAPLQEMETPIHQVFGGLLQTRISCKECDYVSTKDDPFRALHLDVSKSKPSLIGALRNFTAPSALSGAEKYHCEKCKRKVEASMNTVVRQAPNVLTIVLKRFANTTRSGRTSKINAFIPFPADLDLSHQMHGKPAHIEAKYQLSGIVVHEGYDTSSGHYFAYVKNRNGTWARKDDSTSRDVALSRVLNEKAYILFYTRKPSVMKLYKKPVVTPGLSQALAFERELLAVTTKQAEADSSDSTVLEPGSGPVSPTPGNGYTTRANNTNSPTSSTEHPAISRSAAGPSRAAIPRNTPINSRPEPPPRIAGSLHLPKDTRFPYNSTTDARVSQLRRESPNNKQRINGNYTVSSPSSIVQPRTGQAPHHPNGHSSQVPEFKLPANRADQRSSATCNPSSLKRLVGLDGSAVFDNFGAEAKPAVPTLDLKAVDPTKHLPDQPLSPSVITSVKNVLVIGVETAKRAITRVFGGEKRTPDSRSQTPSPDPPSAPPTPPTRPLRQVRAYGSPKAIALARKMGLFQDVDVGTWDDAPERDLQAQEFKSNKVSKRRRAGDELDAVYDTGKTKKNKRPKTNSKGAFKKFAEANRDNFNNY